jgi:hypothetical protein
MTILRVDVDDRGVWTFTGGREVAPVARPSAADERGAVRSTLMVSPDISSMVAEWELSEDGSAWKRWMNMTFSRM